MTSFHSKAETLLATGIGMMSSFIGAATGVIEISHDAMSAFVVGGAGALGGLVVKKGWEHLAKRREQKRQSKK